MARTRWATSAAAAGPTWAFDDERRGSSRPKPGPRRPVTPGSAFGQVLVGRPRRLAPCPARGPKSVSARTGAVTAAGQVSSVGRAAAEGHRAAVRRQRRLAVTKGQLRAAADRLAEKHSSSAPQTLLRCCAGRAGTFAAIRGISGSGLVRPGWRGRGPGPGLVGTWAEVLPVSFSHLRGRDDLRRRPDHGRHR